MSTDGVTDTSAQRTDPRMAHSKVDGEDRASHLKTYVNWQFHVVYLGSVVLKVLKRDSSVRAAITSRKWGRELSKERIELLVRETRNDAIASLQALRCRPDACKLAGRPRFLSKGLLLQDRGTTLLDLVIQNGMTQISAVQAYFDLTLGLWKAGLFEVTFDFLRNTGVDWEQRMFFVDVGGFTASAQKAKRLLAKRYWRGRHDYLALDEPARSTFEKLAVEHFSVASFDRQFNSGL